jgi:hypothetical protein
MTAWSAVVVAIPSPPSWRSRLPVPWHPLAGRPIAWHALRWLQRVGARLRELRWWGEGDWDPAWADGVPVDGGPGSGDPPVAMALIDAAAPLLADRAAALVAEAPGRALGWAGRPALVWADPVLACAALERPEPLRWAAEELGAAAWIEDAEEGLVVADRADLALAARRLRDRLVRRQMDAGVTFLLPETVWIDVDVRIGRDSVVYPGAVLEGATEIGEEVVIGPGCRLIDARVGSGAELKGWNYVVRAHIRNRVVLEPYVRRGMD